jgi:hypothetical protein
MTFKPISEFYIQLNNSGVKIDFIFTLCSMLIPRKFRSGTVSIVHKIIIVYEFHN